MDSDIAEGGGVTIGVDDVRLLVKLGPGRSLLDDIMLRKIAAAAAQRRGMSVPPEQLDASLADFYASLGLFEPEQVAEWLETVKVDEAVLRQYLREWLLQQRFKTVLIPEATARQRFSSSPYDFATLHVQKIVVPGRGAAAELALQLRESEITWEQAARQSGAMESLIFRRQDAPPEAAAELYVAPLGGFVGPLEETLGTYAIYRVTWRVEPKLDDLLMEEIRARLYDQALRAALVDQPVRFLR